MKNLFLLLPCLLLIGCVEQNASTPTVIEEKPLEVKTEPRKECDKTCRIYTDQELLLLATGQYTSTELKTDIDSEMNICVSVKLIKNLASIDKRVFRMCLDTLAESTITGYNSSIQYLANKDFDNFFNVSLRCASAQFSEIPIKQIAYNYCM